MALRSKNEVEVMMFFGPRRHGTDAGLGLMLQGGAEEYAESAPWMAVWPGVAISLGVFGFNLFGDALRDVLDPKLRQK